MGNNGLSPQEQPTAETGTTPTEEEKAAQKEEKERKKKMREERDKRIAILRGMSLRIPLMVFGAELKDENTELTLDNFTALIDDDSWNEFMPRGVTKEDFNGFKKCYDPVRFAEAGKKYRIWARMADSQPIEERIRIITEIHSFFHNPDKETVLTPWRIVNLHLSNTLGGYCFFNEAFDGPNLTDQGEETSKPRWVEQEDITKEIFNQVNPQDGSSPVHILEINSKTGLYPLYMAYSLYRAIKPIWLDACKDPLHPEAIEEDVLWNKILQENIFVICNTPMAARITERTLRGFRKVDKMHVQHIHLIDEAVEDQKALVEKLTSSKFWKTNEGKKDMKMKFNVIVGNPPYQIEGMHNNNRIPIYPYFWDLAVSLSDITSFISPARFLFNEGQTPRDWNVKMLRDEHLRVVDYFENSKDVFPSVDIRGGIAIIIRNSRKKVGAINEFIPNEQLRSIANHFVKNPINNLPSIIYGGRSDLKFNQHFLETYPNSIQDRIRAIQMKHSDFTSLSQNEEFELKSSTFSVLPYAFIDEEPEDNREQYYQIIGLLHARRVRKWIQKEFMTPRYKNNNISKYKVCVPESNGSGKFGEVLSTPFVEGPDESTTPTFISIGNLESNQEAENLSKYIRTKLVRTLLGLCKKTQHNRAEDWAYIPLQDFSEKSDIDWTKSVKSIDQQLYKKYNLSQSEIDFIETHVQPME